MYKRQELESIKEIAVERTRDKRLREFQGDVYKRQENKRYFQEGLEAMLSTLEPEIVLVYGAMPDVIFSPYTDVAQFVHYPDWISSKKKKVG